MHMEGAISSPAFSPDGHLPGKKNYFIETDQTKWALGVPLYSRVESRGVYPGVDMAYHGSDHGLEFDFVVAPKADPRRIKFDFTGAQRIKLEASGDLSLLSAAGELRLHQPMAYQKASNGTRKEVAARFVLLDDGAIQIALGAYDRQRPLIIDPSVTFATYLGGEVQDEGLGVAVDNAGNTYVTGATNSVNFPATDTFPPLGGFDVFVTAFDPTGHLLFSTVLGGSSDDVGTAIAVSDGTIQAIYLTGWTESLDMPIEINGINYYYEAGKDAFR